MIISRDNQGRIVTSDGCKPLDWDVNGATEYYNNNHSIREVAKFLGISESPVQRKFKKLGISRDKGWRNRGKKLSLETINKMSNSQKILHNDPIYKKKHCIGKNNPFYGHKHNPKTIEAMKRKLSILLSGANNPQWQGGKSLEPYGYDFKHKLRHKVYGRDNYTCQKCGVQYKNNEGRLVAHHINRDKKNGSMDNLITLCRHCHGITAMDERWGKEVEKTL